LLQIVLHAQIATESGEFLMADVIETVDAKLRRRHPHVFGDVEVNGVSEVLVNWEAIKKAEKAGRTENEGDEQEAQGVLDKIAEEAEEVAAAESPEAREAEIGDLLFSLVNVARWLGVDAETALRTTNERFSWRFRTLERLAQQRGLNLGDLNIEALDELWEEAKRMEARASGRMSE
jgi:tetrapyrrole methylase family protein/MazG family protein